MRGFNRGKRPAATKVEPAPVIPAPGGASSSGLVRAPVPPALVACVSETAWTQESVDSRRKSQVDDIQHPSAPEAAPCKTACACAPVGVMGLLKKDDYLITSWLANCKAMAAPAAKGDSDDDEVDIDEVAAVDQEPPWECWERIAQEHAEILKPCSDAAVAVTAAKGTVTSQLRDSDNDLVPAMPTVPSHKSNDSKPNFSDIVDNHKHRHKVSRRRFPFNALVALPVTKK